MPFWEKKALTSENIKNAFISIRTCFSQLPKTPFQKCMKDKEGKDWIAQRQTELGFLNQLVQGPNRKKVGLLGVDLKKLGTSWLWSRTNVFGVTAGLGSLSLTDIFFFDAAGLRWIHASTASSVVPSEWEDELSFLKNGKPCPAQPEEVKRYISSKSPKAWALPRTLCRSWKATSQAFEDRSPFPPGSNTIHFKVVKLHHPDKANERTELTSLFSSTATSTKDQTASH